MRVAAMSASQSQRPTCVPQRHRHECASLHRCHVQLSYAFYRYIICSAVHVLVVHLVGTVQIHSSNSQLKFTAQGLCKPTGFQGGGKLGYISTKAPEHKCTAMWTRMVGNHRHLLPACTSICLLYTSPSPRDRQKSRMPSSA